MYLSRVEQSVEDSLPLGVFISFDEINRVLKNFSVVYLSEVLGRLARKQSLTRVGKGSFYTGKPSDSFFSLRQGLFLGGKASYIGFASALYFHHLIDEAPRTVFVATKDLSGNTVRNGFEYRFIRLGEKCAGAERFDNIFVSKKAKTFFDCFSFPEYAGGFARVFNALEHSKLSADDWRELLFYLDQFGSAAVKQRLGYLAEKKDLAPGFFTRGLKKSLVSSKTVSPLLPEIKSKGFFNKTWHVIDNSKGGLND